MLKERTYSATNKCLNRIKSSGLDQMLKVRLECHFIRLKRHILASPHNVMMEDMLEVEELSEQVIRSEDKELSAKRLEDRIREIVSSSETIL